jgi:hypothetical protein
VLIISPGCLSNRYHNYIHHVGFTSPWRRSCTAFVPTYSTVTKKSYVCTTGNEETYLSSSLPLGATTSRLHLRDCFMKRSPNWSDSETRMLLTLYRREIPVVNANQLYFHDRIVDSKLSCDSIPAFHGHVLYIGFRMPTCPFMSAQKHNVVKSLGI